MLAPLFPRQIKRIRPGRHLVEGAGICSMNVITAADKIKAEVRNDWAYFYDRKGRRIFSCNTTYFVTWYRYA